MDEVTDPSLKILGRSIKSIPLFIKGILIKYLSWLILTESILGITSCQECSLVQLMTLIVKLISLIIQNALDRNRKRTKNGSIECRPLFFLIFPTRL